MCVYMCIFIISAFSPQNIELLRIFYITKNMEYFPKEIEPIIPCNRDKVFSKHRD
jgi:hypothetical protein